MNVTLSDGTIGVIPDGLDDNALDAAVQKLDAANKASKPPPAPAPSTAASPSFWDKVVAFGNMTPTQAIAAIPTADQVFPRDQYPGIAAARDWMRANVTQSAPGNFVGNVAGDVAALPWDLPASVLNPLLHTAQNYGRLQNVESAPLLAPSIKEKMGVTPSTDPLYNAAETAAQATATSGESLIPAAASALWSVAKGYGGSWLGGKIADATDPRLHELFATAGGIGGSQAPVAKAAAPVVGAVFGAKDAATTMQNAKDVQGATGSPSTPVTAGQLGGPFIKTIENWLGKIPVTGAPIHSAQADVQSQIEQAVQQAAKKVSAGSPVSLDANAPGAALLDGVRAHVQSTTAAAKTEIDKIEKQLGTLNTRGPGGGSAMVDVRGLVNDLNGLKTATDAAGNVRATVAPEIASQIDAEIANINRARQPENPALHTQLQSRTSALQGFLGQSGVDPGVRAQVEGQLRNAQATQDANLKVPFEALRQMKTLQGADMFGDGTPTLNGYMGGKVYDAYGGALQRFADQLDPAFGAEYSKANGAYKTAADLRRTFKNTVDNADQQCLTTTMKGGLTAPEKVIEFSTATPPPVWNQAAANTIAMLGRATPGAPFNVKTFAQTWSSMPDDAKALYTRGSPDMRKVLDAAAGLGSGFDPTGGRNRPITASEAFIPVLLDRAMSGILGERGAAAATAAASVPYATSKGLESDTFKSGLAGRTPWSVNLPALIAVAQQQGRQGY